MTTISNLGHVRVTFFCGKGKKRFVENGQKFKGLECEFFVPSNFVKMNKHSFEVPSNAETIRIQFSNSDEKAPLIFEGHVGLWFIGKGDKKLYDYFVMKPIVENEYELQRFEIPRRAEKFGLIFSRDEYEPSSSESSDSDTEDEFNSE